MNKLYEIHTEVLPPIHVVATGMAEAIEKFLAWSKTNSTEIIASSDIKEVITIPSAGNGRLFVEIVC